MSSFSAFCFGMATYTVLMGLDVSWWHSLLAAIFVVGATSPRDEAKR